MVFGVFYIFVIFCLLLITFSAGEFVDVTVDRLLHFNNRSDYALIKYDKIQIRKYNRTHQAGNGELAVMIDLDNNVEFSADLFVSQGNEYRKTPFRVLRSKFCEVAKTYKSFYEDLAAVSNLPPTLGCPVVPKGYYTVTNYVLDVSSLPKIFDGKFVLIFSYYYLQQPADTSYMYIELRHYD